MFVKFCQHRLDNQRLPHDLQTEQPSWSTRRWLVSAKVLARRQSQISSFGPLFSSELVIFKFASEAFVSFPQDNLNRILSRVVQLSKYRKGLVRSSWNTLNKFEQLCVFNVFDFQGHEVFAELVACSTMASLPCYISTSSGARDKRHCQFQAGHSAKLTGHRSEDGESGRRHDINVLPSFSIFGLVCFMLDDV